MPMIARRFRSLLLPLLSLLLLIGACAAPEPEFDRDGLEQVEDLAESLANDLLAFSVAVRDRDVQAIARFTAEQVRASEIPAAPSDPGKIVKWIHRRDWNWSSDVEAIPGEVFVDLGLAIKQASPFEHTLVIEL